MTCNWMSFPGTSVGFEVETSRRQVKHGDSSATESLCLGRFWPLLLYFRPFNVIQLTGKCSKNDKGDVSTTRQSN